MNAPMKNLQQEKVDALAAKYAQAGFEVVKEPGPADLPFDMGFYRPQLLARKGNEGLIFEVRASSSYISVDRFQSIAEEIAEHPGWRFLLVTLDDVDEKAVPTTLAELPGWAELSRRLEEVGPLIEQRALAPAVLYLWSIFEAGLRRWAIEQNIPVERFPEKALLNHLYSHGAVSVDHIDTLQEFLDRHNRIAHGASESIDSARATEWFNVVAEFVSEWKQEIVA
jgi:hypothetical protein